MKLLDLSNELLQKILDLISVRDLAAMSSTSRALHLFAESSAPHRKVEHIVVKGKQRRTAVDECGSALAEGTTQYKPHIATYMRYLDANPYLTRFVKSITMAITQDNSRLANYNTKDTSYLAAPESCTDSIDELQLIDRDCRALLTRRIQSEYDQTASLMVLMSKLPHLTELKLTDIWDLSPQWLNVAALYMFLEEQYGTGHDVKFPLDLRRFEVVADPSAMVKPGLQDIRRMLCIPSLREFRSVGLNCSDPRNQQRSGCFRWQPDDTAHHCPLEIVELQDSFFPIRSLINFICPMNNLKNMRLTWPKNYCSGAIFPLYRPYPSGQIVNTFDMMLPAPYCVRLLYRCMPNTILQRKWHIRFEPGMQPGDDCCGIHIHRFEADEESALRVFNYEFEYVMMEGDLSALFQL